MVLTYVDFKRRNDSVCIVVLYCLICILSLLPAYVVQFILEHCTVLSMNQIYHIISFCFTSETFTGRVLIVAGSCCW